MNLPPLSQEQLAAVFTSARTPSELYETLAQYEAQACLLSTPNSKETELLSLFYSMFFFSHLLLDDIYEARAMTKRMPQDLAHTDSSLQNCLNLLRAVWQRKYEQVYTILRELPWPESLKPIVQRYDQHFQEKTLKEVSRVYEAIRPDAAANYLGLDVAAAKQGDPAIIKKFTACGWAWDEKTMLFYPKPIISPADQIGHLSNNLGEVMALLGTRSG
ncbi:CSN8/PSMD8/EIF3K family protein [Aspergillus clavatus NRRL 1]|uniref:COP9 signalosome complex subunit 8 n=1 Tax=Aspergillus clavatus (strain ATCC 1007 / CBS 513.65 / DSM 816 / NCTC 3887 / NRRL 1 / QM 1276 / 107) TaxID=344612 RepID=A1C3Y5_ASPCL|nr:COP9 signalosome subunit 8 (CsnH), putative [Aspergillus clavatus NRRL 1]EAW15125.1 COP9 signalosome subunit 8 (CsnH), putative [Aspergillus clavatus NRRL 1]